MKKIIALLLTIATLCTAALAAVSCGEQTEALDKAYNKYLAEVKAPTDAEKTLTVATSPDFAPLEFVDLAKSGQDSVVGFDILLANYIAKQLNMKLVVKTVSFDAAMTAVQTGQADLGMSGFSWTAKRAESFNISTGYEAGEAASDQVIVTKAGVTFSSVADFAGKTVGAQGASLQEMLTKEQLVPAGAKLQQFSKTDEAITALKAGQVDAVALEQGNADAVLANNSDLHLSGFKFEVDDKYKYNVILINKNNDELLAQVNEILAELKAKNVFNDWYDACKVYANVGTLDDLGFDDDGNKIKKDDAAE